MKKKYYTDSIGIEIEIDEKTRALKRIDITEIDTEVFPPLAVDDKTKMSWLVDAIARQVMALLSDPRMQEKRGGAAVQEGKIQTHTCEKCGRTFDVKQPCCGGKVSRELCPGCHAPVMIRWE